MNVNKIEIGGCTLYNGDCYEVLEYIDSKSVNLVHSDPPYVIHSGKGNSDLYESHNMNLYQEFLHSADISSGFNMEFVFNELNRICVTPNYQIWCSKKQFPELLNYAISMGQQQKLINIFKSSQKCSKPTRINIL